MAGSDNIPCGKPESFAIFSEKMTSTCPSSKNLGSRIEIVEISSDKIGIFTLEIVHPGSL